MRIKQQGINTEISKEVGKIISYPICWSNQVSWSVELSFVERVEPLGFSSQGIQCIRLVTR